MTYFGIGEGYAMTIHRGFIAPVVSRTGISTTKVGKPAQCP
jgi:hypothetical protein